MTAGPLEPYPCLNPACGAVFDDASEPGARRVGGARPTVGALNLCPYCGDVAMFETPTSLRPLTAAEWVEVEKQSGFHAARRDIFITLALHPDMRKPAT